MRDNVKGLVKLCSGYFEFPEPICEIGSLQVPNQEDYSDLRPFFPGKKYIGCDFREGLGVDRVENIENLNFEDESIGSLLTLDTLEHVQNPHKALENIYRVLKPGGFVIMSSVQNFPIHAFPNDYWRFTPEAFNYLLRNFQTRIFGSQGYYLNPHTVFGIGFKKYLSDEELNRFKGQCMAELVKYVPKSNKTRSFKLAKSVVGMPYISKRVPPTIKPIFDNNVKVYFSNKPYT